MESNGNSCAKDTTLIRIGSRDSELAMKQTYMVRDALKKVHPKLEFEIITMKTMGDKILNLALSKIGSKSLFTKELETALEEGQVDMLVHSLKDLPTTLPDGLVIGCVSEREDPRDAVIMHPNHATATLATLPKDSVIGTSSVRRAAQLKRKYPDLKFESVRGNLNTRLRKLDSANDFQALILAAAGVLRMGWAERISQYLGEEECMHAVGQGALAVECREEDNPTLDLLAAIAHPNTTMAAIAERAFMRTLEGGCSAPVAVHTKVTEDSLDLKGGVWSLDGAEQLIHTLSTQLKESDESLADWEQPAKVPKTSLTYCGIVPLHGLEKTMGQVHTLGKSLAQSLLDQGADKILQTAKAENDAHSPANNPNLPPTKTVMEKEPQCVGSS